jgi:phosphomannomutase
LLDALGCSYTLLNSEVNGEFAHNPEPLAENLTDLCKAVISSHADVGIAVDPDVDRLAFVDEKGVYFGEEYTLVTIADYIMQHTPGPCVSNLSSSMALRDLAQSYDQSYSAAKVGEVQVVAEMTRTTAVIGGEGNGGVFYPPLHYGRDALVGIALLLSYLARSGKTLSDLKAGYPKYVIAKNKVDLNKDVNVRDLLARVQSEYPGAEVITLDGVKLLMDGHWIHLRASNTEPIIRIYAESRTAEAAQILADDAKATLLRLSKSV